MKKFFAVICVVICLVSCSLPVCAISIASECQYVSYIQVEEENKAVRRIVDKQSMVQLRSKTKLVPKEKVVCNLLKALELEQWKNNTNIMNQLILLFDKIERIDVKTQYYSVDSKGRPVLLTEAECLAQMEQQKNTESNIHISKAANSHNSVNTDGKLRSTIIAVYVGKQTYNGQKNTPVYIISTGHEWLSGPIVRAKDACSVCVDGEAMPDQNGAMHVGVMQCTQKTLSGTRYVDTSLTPVVKSGNGVLAEVYLSPFISGYGTIYSNFTILLTCKYIVTDTSSGSKLFRIWAKYVHSWLGVNVSVGWELGSKYPGVTISPAFQTTEYGFSMDVSTGSDYS